MSQDYGIQAPAPHSGQAHRKAARYLVVIGAGGPTVARLFQDDFAQVAEIDAGTEEVTLMTKGLTPVVGARGADWEKALRGHTAAERATAAVYTLDP